MAPAAPIVGHSAGFLAGFLAWLNLAWLGLVGLIGFGLALLAYWLGLFYNDSHDVPPNNS